MTYWRSRFIELDEQFRREMSTADDSKLCDDLWNAVDTLRDMLVLYVGLQQEEKK
jgi:hypothetical protein